MEHSSGPPPPISQELRDTITRIALEAVQYAATLRFDHADRTMRQLAAEFGSYLGEAMVIWCDFAMFTTMKAVDTQQQAERAVRAICRPETRWAAKVLKARTDMNAEAFIACIDEVNTMDGRDGYRAMYDLMALCATIAATSAAICAAEQAADG